MDAFNEFVRRHGRNADFVAECRLLEPVINGAGLIYVVDGSLPVTDMHRCEMEILRLTAAPRLAIINCTGAGEYSGQWKLLLG